MADIVRERVEGKKHDHLELHALINGGYVIREGRFDGDRNRGDNAMWNWQQERAAFATLKDALAWMAANMVDRSPEIERPKVIDPISEMMGAEREAGVRAGSVNWSDPDAREAELAVRAALHEALRLVDKRELVSTVPVTGYVAVWKEDARKALDRYNKG